MPVPLRTDAPRPARRGSGDVRLDRRPARPAEHFRDPPDGTIPPATGSRNDMDAAYPFFANPRVTPDGGPGTSLPRAQPLIRPGARVRVVQGTTDCNYDARAGADGLGGTDGADVSGRMVHASRALTSGGRPLGLLAQPIGTRDPKDEGRGEARHRRAAADEESDRWADHARAARPVLPPEVPVAHIADRDGGIDDGLAAPRPSNAHVPVRVAHRHRVVATGPDGAAGPLGAVVGARGPAGTDRLTVPRADEGAAREAVREVRVAAVRVVAPRHAEGRASRPAADVWVIEAREPDPPAAGPVCGCLVTAPPIDTRAEAARAVRGYARRWRIERFHVVLKSGCRGEHLQLGTADRPSGAVAPFSQAAVRRPRLAGRGPCEPPGPGPRGVHTRPGGGAGPRPATAGPEPAGAGRHRPGGGPRDRPLGRARGAQGRWAARGSDALARPETLARLRNREKHR